MFISIGIIICGIISAVLKLVKQFQLATFKAGDKRKTTHQHLFLPKDYSGSPTTNLYTPWSKKEAEAYLTAGWGEGAITEINLEYLHGPEPEVSGE